MTKWGLYIALLTMLVALPAGAQIKMKPRYEGKTVNIFVPHYKAQPQRNKIYTPDRYSCSMRRKLKYCIDRKGRALNGQIVLTNGQTVTYASYINGYQNGETSVYSTDGTLVERAMFKKGVLDGEAVEYYINGNIWLIKHYDDGALNGRVEEYDINGALVGQMTYKKGWLKDGYCRNEKSGKTMHERYQDGKFNQIIPCGADSTSDELM